MIWPRVALDEAGPETGPVVKTSWLAAAGLFVRLKSAGTLTPDVEAVTV